MRIIENDNVVHFDVDETIVCWGDWDTAQEGDIIVKLATPSNAIKKFKVNVDIVNKVKQHYLQGHYVSVWSAGGWQWAASVVEQLGIADYVNEIRCKPKWSYDDMNPSEWVNWIKVGE